MSRGCALQLLSHPLLTFSTHLASARCVFDEACSWTSLLTAYARAGQLNEARSLFDGMPHKTPVAWSAMLSAYVRPNRAAFVGALAACGALRALEQGRWVHALVTGSGVDGVVATTLVDMHAKWGSLEAATQVFAAMLERERDAFAYTAMNES
jgi:pentatricopeptide repeat protein